MTLKEYVEQNNQKPLDDIVIKAAECIHWGGCDMFEMHKTIGDTTLHFAVFVARINTISIDLEGKIASRWLKEVAGKGYAYVRYFPTKSNSIFFSLSTKGIEWLCRKLKVKICLAPSALHRGIEEGKNNYSNL